MTEAKLIEYFNEHVFYELQMLRYSQQWLEEKQPQFVWNAMFAAFNVSARNLYYFVGNRDAGNMNVADYRHYCRTFDRGSIEGVKETMRWLEAQCLHLGEKRFKEPDRKINIDKIRELSAWIVSKMDELLKSFDDVFRAKLRPEWAGLVEPVLNIKWTRAGPSATDVMSILSTGPTGGVGEMITFDITPKK
jgi:hypothetical protein